MTAAAELGAGRDLDALVAQGVFGRRVVMAADIWDSLDTTDGRAKRGEGFGPSLPLDAVGALCPSDWVYAEGADRGRRLPRYSEDPAAALDVVRAMGPRMCVDADDRPCGFFLHSSNPAEPGHWEVSLKEDMMGPCETAWAPTFALAVCRAALMALERNKDAEAKTEDDGPRA